MFKRAGVWWTCIRHNGRKIQKSLETSDKKLAQDIEAKIRTEIVEGSYFEKLVGRNKTFGDMMDKFMAEHAPTVSENTQRSYTTSLKFLLPHFGDSNLISISPKMISRYKVLRKGDGVKPATVNRELAMLSKAFSLAAKEWEWLKDNPVSRVSKEKENNARDRWLSKDEEKRLLDNSPEWIKQIIIFSLNTGLRLGELTGLEWSRVDISNKTILIDNSKNGEQRTIPLNKYALDVVTQRSRVRSLKCDYVFINRYGGKINPNSLRDAFRKILRKVEIDDFRLHDLRHSFATRLTQSDVDLYKISKLLGHKDIKMTQRYAHHCPDSLREGVEVLDVDYNLTTVEENEIGVSS
jgi:integrase|tara:strand:+ start:88 stop:1140 length:1053 start_codon:yes stop_codon:yes gene_type:complete